MDEDRRFRRAQELCESRGGRPGLPVPNKHDGLCGRKATLEEVLYWFFRAQELCVFESRGGRPGFPSLISLMVSVDAKQS